MSLQTVKILVLDEVDRMLDMGFLPDVRRIVEKISTNRQTLLFSATLPPEIERLAAWVLRDPELVEIGVRRSPAETVTHAVYPVAAEQKFDLLMALLERTNFDSVLIFCRTKQNADRVAHFLKARVSMRWRCCIQIGRSVNGSKRSKASRAANTK